MSKIFFERHWNTGVHRQWSASESHGQEILPITTTKTSTSTTVTVACRITTRDEVQLEIKISHTTTKQLCEITVISHCYIDFKG